MLFFILLTLPLSAQWADLSNTHLQSVAPATCTGTSPPSYCAGVTYDYNAFAHAVVDAWGGAVMDTTGTRLILWGGGHGDYNGNEVYSVNLSLSPVTVTRLTDPSIYATSGESNADGTPVSRHTYQDLVFLPVANKMFSYGGIIAPGGSSTIATWLFDLSALTWTRKTDGPSAGSTGGYMCALDTANPSPESVICAGPNAYNLYRYTVGTDTWIKLSAGSTNGTLIPSTASCAIDPVRKLYICAGQNTYGGAASGIYSVDLTGSASYAATNITSLTTGCGAMYGTDYPGLDYDSNRKTLIYYSGTGNTVIEYDPGTKICTTLTYTGGPSATVATGTFGRWAYVPSLNKHVALNNVTADVFTLLLGSSGGGSVLSGGVVSTGVIR